MGATITLLRPGGSSVECQLKAQKIRNIQSIQTCTCTILDMPIFSTKAYQPTSTRVSEMGINKSEWPNKMRDEGSHRWDPSAMCFSFPKVVTMSCTPQTFPRIEWLAVSNRQFSPMTRKLRTARVTEKCCAV